MNNNKHEGCARGFTQLSRAWYGERLLSGSNILDEIVVGLYHSHGGTSGEFSITWDFVMGLHVPKLEAYDDSWSALKHFSNLLDKMAEVDDQKITPSEFVSILTSLGIEDLTPTKHEM